MRHLDIRVHNFFPVFSYEDTNPSPRLSYCGMLTPAVRWIGPIWHRWYRWYRMKAFL